ncbi:MAG: prepilin-type N-terminal cleavage/methylation domain-containing protein [Tissierellia bacterium]|nr:prepilin-type N-terminal cleavage/methylation domain-containing protein [Tissierellia bacterium]HOA20540.1 prepilin-type N-terminal cleavage/methylation domain-containing protein [Sedimentibacter sp.]HPY56636.1 prepilin-type N-terminal cleavage/methylation domain-containing protein [Sedimentibacter sp.]HQK54402.1 prepilin-type N-terminal cleavage/methylation domain-containing protein [Sedimentibacter sp.]HQO73143.1 prepilin-type N-terminal cleavage/methylation domain-containing protein [Sedi
MNKLFNNRGLTLAEVIMTMAILGIAICPLMNLLVLSQNINSEGEKEYDVIQTAQYYMEETRAMGEIDPEIFVYNSEEMSYERMVSDVLDDLSAEIKITPFSYGLHYIEVNILNDGEVINSLTGSIVID